MDLPGAETIEEAGAGEPVPEVHEPESDVMDDEFLTGDADGDTISDRDEDRDIMRDTDGDGVPDYMDLDSDNDTIPDSVEAGDGDLETPPGDTDEDGWPDFRDVDSDGDGLSDCWEMENCTLETISTCCPNPYDPDSDDDGMTDLIEVAVGTDPCNAVEPQPREHVFFAPYREAPMPPEETFVFTTLIQYMDIFFAIDTTESMAEEIASVGSHFLDFIAPAIFAVIPDPWFGVGGIEDFPAGSYGEAESRVFYLESEMTSDPNLVDEALERLSTHGSGDLPEGQVPALWAVAGGGGLGDYLQPRLSCDDGEMGYPCFRRGGLPVVVLITDASFHNGPEGAYPYDTAVLGISPPAYGEAVDALNSIHAKIIAVSTGSPEAMADILRLASDTGAVDIGGNPLVFQAGSDGEDIEELIFNGVSMLVMEVPVSVSVTVGTDPEAIRCMDSSGDPVACCNSGAQPCPGDTAAAVDTAAAFIDRVVPNTAGGIEDPFSPGVFCVGGLEVDDPLDPGYFTRVLPGTAVCFDVFPKMNTQVPDVEEPQVFRVYLKIMGDEAALLDTRQVYFVVPPSEFFE